MTSFKDRVIYQIVRLFCLFFLKLHNRISIQGLENVPSLPPFIMAVNHCSNLDPVVVGAAFPHRLRYLAKVELFQGSKIFAWLLRTLGAIPVSRESSQSAGGALKTFLQLIEEGQAVLLFPEGARSVDGRLKPLEGGVALLAMKSGVPVVPVYISGTHRAMPVGSSRIGWNKVSITFGEPIEPKALADGVAVKEARSIFLKELESRLSSMEQFYLAKSDS
ncbi:lysophospholipid acyltransferase family protein [Dethiosulfovibrio salsuginis]|uniref:1-acyl-sn-glycerol-3-phosphate acyltransferase n=1 Tax=Dethiosulfovibrio salsuginis TaxID=561720 RepID=A0A1X7IBI7_9BACT|nr:lysophospholipid acyltransferase family protein [Dethiosulfovibrio salsuginis]SMG11457.1 1-acyl-sn-glycerol-3-phosphate acyltransferase [Dethiosulfovibrio salsuginis]